VNNAVDISAPCQLICEGRADEAFFGRLLKARSISGFQVRCARSNKQPDKCAGKDGISDTIAAIFSTYDLLPSRIKGVLIAIDSDKDPKAQFAFAQEQIKLGRPMAQPPDRIMEIKKSGGLSIAVMTIPWADQLGNLDTLLFQSLDNTHADIMPPLAEYCKGTEHRTRDWSIGEKSKMQLRCSVAVIHKPDPSQSLTYLVQSSHGPFTFSHARFDQIANYLDGFGKTVNP
jgi:hypothetical protein